MGVHHPRVACGGAELARVCVRGVGGGDGWAWGGYRGYHRAYCRVHRRRYTREYHQGWYFRTNFQGKRFREYFKGKYFKGKRFKGKYLNGKRFRVPLREGCETFAKRVEIRPREHDDVGVSGPGDARLWGVDAVFFRLLGHAVLTTGSKHFFFRLRHRPQRRCASGRDATRRRRRHGRGAVARDVVLESCVLERLPGDLLRHGKRVSNHTAATRVLPVQRRAHEIHVLAGDQRRVASVS
mmetsp:Transcript_13706/g.51273  ORF Transcript_13706/g.51273 Transcript_13706/m.51273 type:complete len:239 (+) Transcript_13706:504-1220(+)